MHIGGEPQPFGLLAKPRRSRQHALRAGIERQCQVQLGKRPLALQGQRHRRPPFDVEDIGNDAVCRLVQREVETENLCFLGVVRVQRHLPAGTIQPRHVERGIQRTVDELKMSADADLRGKAEHAVPERHQRHVKRSDVHGQRQLGNLQRAGLGRRQPLFRHRLAQDVDAVGGQRLDVEPAEEQRPPRPHDAGVGYAQPDPLPVGNRDLGDGGIGRQHALYAVDPDLTVRRRQLAFDIGHEVRSLGLGIASVLRQRGQRKEEQHDGQDKSGQNACPIPT